MVAAEIGKAHPNGQGRFESFLHAVTVTRTIRSPRRRLTEKSTGTTNRSATLQLPFHAPPSYRSSEPRQKQEKRKQGKNKQDGMICFGYSGTNEIKIQMLRQTLALTIQHRIESHFHQNPHSDGGNHPLTATIPLTHN